MEKNSYIITFILILTASVAVLLTGLREVTKEKAALNEEIFNKRAILSAVNDHLGEGVTVGTLSDEEVAQIFENKVEQRVLDMDGNVLEGIQADEVDMAKERKKPELDRKLPLYVYENEEEKYYILSVRGNGLWDEIWGSIALEDDLNTITGVAFDHKGETPGLGAEIKDNPAFPAQFKGKQIYEEGAFVGITVVKNGVKNPNHEVDGISGATITSDGVTEMVKRGLQYYEPYLDQLKQSSMLLQ